MAVTGKAQDRSNIFPGSGHTHTMASCLNRSTSPALRGFIAQRPVHCRVGRHLRITVALRLYQQRCEVKSDAIGTSS
jgi:hypothetical protein